MFIELIMAVALAAPGVLSAGDAARPTPRSETRPPRSEVMETRTYGLRLAQPESGIMQLTNPRNGTTCTLLIVPARPGIDPGIARRAPADVDPGIVGPPPPCVPPATPRHQE